MIVLCEPPVATGGESAQSIPRSGLSRPGAPAERTRNIRKHPSPYVLQRALSDLHVEYALIARLLDEKLRVETLSELHANIQDAFNEFGVQIMLPYMDMSAHNAVVVPPSNWYAAPATPDNGNPPSVIDRSPRLEVGK